MVNKTVLNGTEYYGRSIVFCCFLSFIEGLEDKKQLTVRAFLHFEMFDIIQKDIVFPFRFKSSFRVLFITVHLK